MNVCEAERLRYTDPSQEAAVSPPNAPSLPQDPRLKKQSCTGVRKEKEVEEALTEAGLPVWTPACQT
ncbi:hypothetical protein R3I93_018463 [Phoxinus phoxinus]|uniref:Uncharacterized protein n=1 Tax=Phoxinus phoxinus TaxID=58324 RepID=A0AAN9CC19_9TELE